MQTFSGSTLEISDVPVHPIQVKCDLRAMQNHLDEAALQGLFRERDLGYWQPTHKGEPHLHRNK